MQISVVKRIWQIVRVSLHDSLVLSCMFALKQAIHDKNIGTYCIIVYMYTVYVRILKLQPLNFFTIFGLGCTILVISLQNNTQSTPCTCITKKY